MGILFWIADSAWATSVKLTARSTLIWIKHTCLKTSENVSTRPTARDVSAYPGLYHHHHASWKTLDFIWNISWRSWGSELHPKRVSKSRTTHVGHMSNTFETQKMNNKQWSFHKRLSHVHMVTLTTAYVFMIRNKEIKRDSRTNLIDLPVSPIANHLNELKYPCRILQKQHENTVRCMSWIMYKHNSTVLRKLLSQLTM